MGGSSKKVTVGYKYYLGMHMILCHGPVDRILRIRVDGKDAWLGDRNSGSIYVNNPDLFGGESREGGIQGTVDFEPGGPAQGQNSYLVSKLGSMVPAYRGVVGAVLRQVYIGLNPYLKKWAFRVQRIHLRQNGVAQWYYPKAEIKVASNFKIRQMFFFALDRSGSMDTVVSGGLTRLQIAKTQMKAVLDAIDRLRIDPKVQVDIAVCGWSTSTSQMSRFNVSSADVQDLKNFVDGLSASGGTDFSQPYGNAVNWFQPGSADGRRRAMFFITDGLPEPATSVDQALAVAGPMLRKEGVWEQSPVDVYGISIDLSNTSYIALVENTPQDGIPVVDSADSNALDNAVFFAVMGDSSAMNPAHIIRECLTDPDWGMGYADTEIDDQSFMAAADQLHREQMGISILWDRQTSIEDFIGEIIKHIDAVLYVDRKTGLFTLKLVRGGYNKAALLHLNEDNIDKIENFTRPAFGELTNSVTVNYWNVATGNDASVTAQDIALQQMQQVTIGTTIQYPGFVDPLIASRVAQRDLNSLSSQRATCTVYADRTAKDLTIGDVFKLSWEDYNLSEVVMRVTGIAYGDGRTNRIKITCTEDVFDIPQTAFITPEPPAWEDPNAAPIPIQDQIVFEVPYIELVQQQGQTTVDQNLTAEPDLGYLGVAAGRPNVSSLNSRLFTAPVAVSTFEEVGLVDFCPYGELVSAIGRFTTTFSIQGGADLDLVTVPSWAQIGEELVWVESLTNGVMTVRRAVYDTPPAEHAAGAVVYFWDQYSAGSATEYVNSETVRAKLATVTGSGQLDLALASELQLTLEGRAARPYRPANLAVNGDIDATPNDTIVYPATLTWNHRNRLQETGGAPLQWTDASVTPEDGTTYRVTLLGETIGGAQTQFFQQDLGLVTSYVIDLLAHTIPAGSAILVAQVHTMRGGLASWRPAELKLPLLTPPTGTNGAAVNMFEPGSLEAYPVGGGV